MDERFITAALKEAFGAATEATAKMIRENPDQWYPCGFAWVKIKPARGPLVKKLAEMKLGQTSYEGGFQVYNPSGSATQWMDAKVAGCDAFVAVIRKHFPGTNVFTENRID